MVVVNTCCVDEKVAKTCAAVQYNSVPYGSISLVGCSKLGPGLETLACAGTTDNSIADAI